MKAKRRECFKEEEFQEGNGRGKKKSQMKAILKQLE